MYTAVRDVQRDLRVVAKGIDHPECVAWHAGSLYCGTEGGELLRIDPANGTHSVVGSTGGFITGIAMTQDGGTVICDIGRRAVLRMSPSGDISTLAELVGGQRLSMPNYPLLLPNDLLLVTESGAQWGTDDGYAFTINLQTLETSVVAVDCYRFPNGMTLAKDGRSVYVVESRLPGVVQYDLVDGRLIGRRVVVQMPGTVPDGLAMDEAGTLYIACWRPDRVYQLRSDGVLQVFLDDPTAEYMCAPTNLCFGGPDLRTLFISGLGGWTITSLDVDVSGLPQLTNTIIPIGGNLGYRAI